MDRSVHTKNAEGTAHAAAYEGALPGLRFIGLTLGPLFTYDPLFEERAVRLIYEALGTSEDREDADQDAAASAASAAGAAGAAPPSKAGATSSPSAAACADVDHNIDLNEDPQGAKAGAIAGLVAAELAANWPFVQAEEAHGMLSSMVHHADDTESLAQEYRRLFVGPGAKAAPPWGSVYTDKDQVVFGASTLQLRDWLCDNGITVSTPGSDEPEDHIGTLLMLLAWLTDEKPWLIPEFLELHVLPWAPHFLDGMQQATEHPFFIGLAGITKLSLNGIRDELQLQVKEPRFYR